MKKDAIGLPRRDVMKILADLEFLVVSLDHIGSSDLSKEARIAEIYDFMTEGRVFRRLASMRKMISVRMDKTLSPEERVAVDEAMEKVATWKVRR